MKTTFGSASGSRIKRTVLTVLAIVLFVAALVCVIIALVKSPDAPDNSGSSSQGDPSGDNTPVTPKPPAGGIKTISEYAEDVTFTDSTGSMSIEEITETLLKKLIMAASESDNTAYIITKIESVTPALFNYTQDTSSVCAAPLSANVWFVSSSAKVEYTGNLTSDASGEVFLGGRYIVRLGKDYVLYDQTKYENMPAQEIPTFVWGEYDASTTIGAAEMTLSNGIRLGMEFDAVESKMNGFDSTDPTSARIRTCTKAGYTFTFTLIDSSNNSADDFGLPHDGKCYLTHVSADSTCADEFPRGIKIGDTITDVFTKFPTASTKLQKWADQRLYGAYENAPGNVYCFLEYRTKLGSYRIVAQDKGNEHIGIVFCKADDSNPENLKVEGFEWYLEQ